MATNSDYKFDIDKLKGKMDEMEQHFATLADTLSNINDAWNTKVNVLDQAIFGNFGGQLLATWEANASTFGDFYKNFENWSAVVSTAIANNIDLEADVINNYKSNGATLDGVDEARKYLANGSKGDTSADAKDVLDRGGSGNSSVVSTNNEYGGKTVVYTNSDGKVVAAYYDKDGNLVCKHVYKPSDNGNDTSEDKYYDPYGNELKEKPKVDVDKDKSTDGKTEEQQDDSEKQDDSVKQDESSEEITNDGGVVDDPATTRANLPKNLQPKDGIEPFYNEAKNFNTYTNSNNHVVVEYLNDEGQVIGYREQETYQTIGSNTFSYYDANGEKVDSFHDFAPSDMQEQ